MFNSLPNDKFLDLPKSKAFADNKINASEKLKFVLRRVENIVGNGENAGNQHFLLFPQCFPMCFSVGSLKVVIVWKRVKNRLYVVQIIICVTDWVENSVEKEENAGYQHIFSLFPQYFRKTFSQGYLKSRLCVNPLLHRYSILTHQQQTAFENIVGKEEIARNEQFLLFPQCFLLNQKLVSPFVHIFDIISLLAAELEEPKIGV